MVLNALIAHRAELGDRFDLLVNELTKVREEFQKRAEQLPVVPNGTLDGNVLELKQLEREEAMKWVLIKQKYGV